MTLHPPTILGVPMQETQLGFELSGCYMQKLCTRPGWCAAVSIGGMLVHFVQVGSVEEAEKSIESAITRIREEAARLGT